MNETSRGGGGRGDPPIGGFPPPSSTPNTPASYPTTSTGSEDLPSLGASLGSDFDNFGEGFTLSRLLAGNDTNWADFPDPLTPNSGPNNYRPWEAQSEPSSITTLTSVTTLTTAVPPPNVLAPPSTRHYAPETTRPHHYPPYHHYHQQHIDQRLPSFQSQFQEVPPPHFGGGAYPLVPPPVQAREIPNIQQQFLDERHIQGHTPQYTPLQARPQSKDLDDRNTPHRHNSQQQAASSPAEKFSSADKYSSPDRDSTSSMEHQHPTLAAQLRKKARTGSLESEPSDMSTDTPPGQVAAISSTDQTTSSPDGVLSDPPSFKPPMQTTPPAVSQASSPASGGLMTSSSTSLDGDKPVKKKRKRCGECTGCQKKDNCGECAPCRNDKSHQICKQRRCERLTEKKVRKVNVSKPRKNGNFNAEFRSSAGLDSKMDARPRAGMTSFGSFGFPPGQTTPMGSGSTWNTSGDQQWHYSSSPMGPPPPFNQATPTPAGSFAPFISNNFDYDGFSRPPSSGPLRSPVNGRPTPTPPGQQHYLDLPSPNMNSGFHGINGNPNTPTPLGYNLAVNTETKPAVSYLSPRGAGGQIGGQLVSPRSAAVSGNFQPGFPARPAEQHKSNSLSSNSDGSSGNENRTGHSSPDTTTAFTPQQSSFLAFSAGDAPTTDKTLVSTASAQSIITQNQRQMTQNSRQMTLRPRQTTLLARKPMHQEMLDPHIVNYLRQQSPMAPEALPPSVMTHVTQNLRHPAVSRADLERLQRRHAERFQIPVQEKPKTEPVIKTEFKKENVEVKSEPQDNEAILRLKKNLKLEAPPCNCFGPNEVPPESGPYYTHLGVARTIKDLRSLMEMRTGVEGKALRIEKARHCHKEGKSKQGCPIAKWILRRSSYDEKFLLIVKYRTGHRCENSWIVVSIVAWEGVDRGMADNTYDMLTRKLPNYGVATPRRCGTNTPNTCACQGLSEKYGGASFTFGCSWSMYYDMCKFCRSRKENVRKFKLTKKDEEPEMEHSLQHMATMLGPLYKRLAPDSFANMTAFEDEAPDCRIGLQRGRPFSGVTAVCDFCAHAHRDNHNMNAGCTVVVTLNRPENRLPIGQKPDDEQLHVLPLYAPDPTDENGSVEGFNEKVRNGAIEVLDKFERVLSIRDEPLKRCKRGHPTGHRKKFLDNQYKIKKAEESAFMSPPATPEHPSTRGRDGKGWGRGRLVEEILNILTPPSPGMQNAVYAASPVLSGPPTTGAHQTPSTVRSIISHTGFHGFSAMTHTRQLNPQAMPKQHEPPVLHLPSGMNPPEHVIQLPSGMECPDWMSDILAAPNANEIMNPRLRPADGMFPNALWGNAAVPQLDGLADNQTFQNVQWIPQLDGLADNQTFQNVQWIPQLDGQADPGQPAERHQSMPPPPPPSYIGHHQQAPPSHTSPSSVQHQYSMGWSPSWPPRPPMWTASPQMTPRVTSPHTVTSSQMPSPASPHPMVTSPQLTSPPPKVTYEHSDCEENFHDSSIGGVAIALTHGSVLFECAKHELHATTALKNPDRSRPCRIGLVFYQHKALNNKDHGVGAWKIKLKEKYARDYQAWMDGLFVPTPRKLQQMREEGYFFPDDVMTVPPGMNLKPEDIIPPDLSFLYEQDDSYVRGRPLKPATVTREQSVDTHDTSVRVSSSQTTTWTVQQPSQPCTVSGPYNQWAFQRESVWPSSLDVIGIPQKKN